MIRTTEKTSDDDLCYLGYKICYNICDSHINVAYTFAKMSTFLR